MYYDLDKLDVEIIDNITFPGGLIFKHNNELFFYKATKHLKEHYNELLAEKIAKRLGINCCSYYLGSYRGFVGNASALFKRENYQSMAEFLQEIYGRKQCYKRNNIISIRDAFYKEFNLATANKLTEELINIFLFDALIGNEDRHADNYGLIRDGKNVSFAPLFDNEKMLGNNSINDGWYALGIDQDDYKAKENLLYKFLNNNYSYKIKLKEMLPVISEESIEEIFLELEMDGINIKRDYKEIIKEKFSINREMINNYNNIKIKKKTKNNWSE